MQSEHSSGNAYFDGITYFFFEQCLSNGRFNGYFTFTEICLMWTDNGICHFCTRCNVGHFDFAQQLYFICAES